MHQAIRAGNAEIAKAISPIDICSHRRCARLRFFRHYPLFRGERCAKLSALSGIDALGGAIQRKPSGRDPCLECMGSSWAG